MNTAITDPLSHLFGTAASPSADLYFAWSCARMFDDGRVQRLSPTVFQAGRTLIVFRHAANLTTLPSHDRLIYVIDDDWRAGLEWGAVPLDYRLKLAWVDARGARRLERHADLFVVSSAALQRRYQACYPNTRIELVDPFWSSATAARVPLAIDPPVIAMLGGRSHAKDISMVLPAVKAVLSNRRDVKLVVSREITLSPDLAQMAEVERVPSAMWGDYRRWMAGRSFTLGLYPLRDTAFNRARSINKLLEYDQFGAAVLASDAWEAAGDAGEAGRCLMIKNDWRCWADRILELLNAPGEVAAIAKRNRAAITSVDNAARQYAFWSRLLH